MPRDYQTPKPLSPYYASINKSNRRSKVPFHQGYHRLRHRVENLFQRLKRFRAVGTRYDKSDVHLGGGVHLSAVIDWLKFGL